MLQEISVKQIIQLVNEYIEEIWPRVDKDGNGTLDKEETRKFLGLMFSEVGEDPNFSESEFEKFFSNTIDVDGNGVLDKKEIKQLIFKMIGMEFDLQEDDMMKIGQSPLKK